ncbi:four helix bundle protein [Chryseobacterium defluvii]|uniref:four helix bundle protein n=1 Tax=Chryseobacterium defluvii TaxID=160396 RepID=UPI00293BC159|nr:four helix bundle protein [Chryseobacterium defluvii]
MWEQDRVLLQSLSCFRQKTKNKEKRIKTYNFKNLNIWRFSIELTDEIYILTDSFPKSEEFGLKSQIRRCSVSVASNIAEGSSRSSNKDFNRFLEISLGSLYELQTQIIISSNRNYFDLSKLENIENKITELQKMISGFQKNLKL